MIAKTRAFTTTDGNTYGTLELAQRAELQRLLTEPTSQTGHVPLTEETAQLVAGQLVAMREEFVSILCASGRKPRVKKAPKRKGKAEVSA